MKIKKIQGLQILDSRGNPTVRAFITLENGQTYSASVPSGASTGSHEAAELRDGAKNAYSGLGVTKAVAGVNTLINEALAGKEADPNTVDSLLLKLDGTENKAKLGANALLSVSLAAVKAAAGSGNLPLWKFINQYYFKGTNPSFPKLMVNVVNGGKHANWNFDIQEFMVVPNDNLPSSSTKMASEIFHSLGKVLKQKNLSTLLGDEGGYSPALSSNEEVLGIIQEAASNLGYENVKDYRLSLDIASTEFYEDGMYVMHKTGKKLTGEELIKYYQEIGIKNFILSFEDAFAEDDWEHHKIFAGMAEKFQFITVGDDLFVTNPKRIKRGLDEKAANAVLVKINQIGTVLETAEAIKMTKSAGWSVIISHRSGETEDPFIADLAYACAADFIKTGSMARSERLAKYNRLLEIEVGL
jgi:enolase